MSRLVSRKVERGEKRVEADRVSKHASPEVFPPSGVFPKPPLRARRRVCYDGAVLSLQRLLALGHQGGYSPAVPCMGKRAELSNFSWFCTDALSGCRDTCIPTLGRSSYIDRICTHGQESQQVIISNIAPNTRSTMESATDYSSRCGVSLVTEIACWVWVVPRTFD